jgi:PAS domain S-box-containing protein
MTRDRPVVEDHLRSALNATGTGLWEWNLDTGDLYWNETCERLFGYKPGSFPATYDAFTERILEADRDTVEAQITTAIQTGDQYEVEFRIEQPDGEHRWIRSCGVVEKDETGEAARMVGTHADVTAEQERQRELESYRKLFENTTDCVVEIERVDGDSLIRRVNTAFEETFGYTEAEIRDQDIHDVLTPEEHRDQAMKIRQEYLAGNQPVMEVTRNTADGQREFLMRAVNFEDRFYVVYTDITERKERERVIENARTKLRQIVDLVPDPLYAKNRDDEVLLSNEANAELHGMTPEEIEGTRERTIESEVENIENFDKYRQREIEVMNTGEPMTVEEELTDPDGDIRVFQTTRIPFEAPGTDEDAVLGYARDVTEQKAYAEELEELNTRLELALEETDTGVWSWDVTTDQVQWDETSERLFGYDAMGFSGTFEGFADRVPEDDLQHVREQVDHAIETGEQYKAEFRVRPPEGRQRWILARGVVRYDDSGTAERLLGIQTDITERKENERELRKTKRELERQNEQLEEFAGVVSHDIRNPLGIAKGRAAMLEEVTGDEYHEHLRPLGDALNRMEQIITDTLTLARQGQTVGEMNPVPLVDLVGKCWASVDTDTASLDVTDEGTLQGDADRLRHVFENLFRNAIEHGGDEVTVRVGVTDDGCLYVEDDGPGIPPDEREMVLEAGHTTAAGGTGFGLTIVKRIAEAHGWTISITEGRGGGARFEFDDVMLPDNGDHSSTDGLK